MENKQKMQTTFKKSIQKILLAWIKKKFAPSLKDSLATARLHALKQNIKDAQRFLRKTHLKSLFYRRKLPWHLVLGSSQAGKTSLLSACGLELVSTNGAPLAHIAPTAYCQWFFGKEAVFIDTSGNLMLPQPIDRAALHLWKKFIRLLYRCRHFHPLDGAILTIDFLDFQEKSFEARRQYIDALLHHLHAFPYPISVYIVLTRCDRLQGFTEFFHTLTLEERDQICGITLPSVAQQDFSQSVETQFNCFLERLNQQIIPHIQRERDIKKRTAIKNFPLQLEAQKRTIIQISNQLHSTKNPVKGIYFTSSQQEGMQNDVLLQLLDTFGFAEQANTSDRPLQKNVFFVNNALKKIIHAEKETTPHPKNIKQKVQRLLNSTQFYLSAISIFTLFLLLTLSSYFYNRQAIQEVHLILATYQHQQPGNPQTDTLALLNMLTKGQTAVRYANNPFTGFAFRQAGHLNTQLTTLYHQALNDVFAPKLEKILALQLQTDIEKKSPRLFDTLKIYLMMGDNTHRDLRLIDGWFSEFLLGAAQDTPANNNPFITHLNAWLAQSSATFPANIKLIANARAQLQNIPPKNLVYSKVEQTYQSIHTEGKNLLYSPENFKKIYQEDIPNFSEKMVKNDAWVLDENIPNSLTGDLVSQLTSDVQQRYTLHYAEFWTTQLSNLTVPHFDDLNEIKLFTTTLNTPDSLLLESLDMIQKNLAPVATTNEGRETIARITQIRALLTKTAGNEKVNHAIQNFSGYLNEILSSKDTAHTIFTATEKRMQNHDKDAITALKIAAKQAPAPMDQWLNQLAANTWQTMLQLSQNHLNTVWQAEVFPLYETKISNRYPIFKNAVEDITLADFSEFFGQNGTLDSFFKHYLSAFVDTSTLYWQWKKVDGLHLDIPQNTLEMLNRASLIRKMYFSDDEKMPTVKFSLTPENVSLISDDFQLILGSQSVRYTTDFRQAKSLYWPDKKSAEAMLEKEDMGKKKIFYEEAGPWSLFRLFAHAHVKNSHNPKLYQLEFELNNRKVTYDLLANKDVNAFIPNILTAFRCPEGLQ